MIIGAHTLIYSRDPEADRAFFRDVLQLDSVDAGRGWLIFALPPGEVAVHPADDEAEVAGHKMVGATLFLMCDDLQKTIGWLKTRQVECGPLSDERWGTLTTIRLPSGGELGLYQPKHPLAIKI